MSSGTDLEAEEYPSKFFLAEIVHGPSPPCTV